jgi:methyltransferase (TIGR00027 family)
MTRTENDTWDLASSVGATATGVAASRALASRGPDALLDDPFAEPLVRAVGTTTFVQLLDGGETDDPLLNHRAMIEQVTVRTRYFDDFFTAAADSGIRQAVILASGLDTRAYRLQWPTGSTVYELDQPEVIDFKTRTLAELGAKPAARLRTVAIDLRKDWPSALQAAGFDTTQPTAWIAEGLLVYLPPEAQDRLFDHIAALSVPGSRIATEHMDMTGLSADWAHKMSARYGTKFNLTELYYIGERNSAADYLSAYGWQVDVSTIDETLAAHGFDVPNDELAKVSGDSGYLTATLK